MSVHSQENRESRIAAASEGAGRFGREVPVCLESRLEALREVTATQRLRPWYQSSWVTVSTVALFVLGLGFVAIEAWLGGNRSDEYGTALLEALHDGVISADEGELIETTAIAPGTDESRFFAGHGAPSRFYPPAELGEQVSLIGCDVVRIGSEPVSVRRYCRPDGSVLAVYSIRQDGLDHGIVNRIHALTQHNDGVALDEDLSSLNLIVSQDPRLPDSSNTAGNFQ